MNPHAAHLFSMRVQGLSRRLKGAGWVVLVLFSAKGLFWLGLAAATWWGLE